MEDLQLPSFLNDPSVKKTALKIIEVIQDRKFQDAAESITHHPHLKWFYFAVIVTFLVYAFARYRILAVLKSFWIKILVRIILFCVFSAMLCGVGYLFFGEPLVYILRQSFKIIAS